MRKAVGIILSVIQILLAIGLIYFMNTIGYVGPGIERVTELVNYFVIYPAIVFGILGVIFLVMFITEKKLTK